MIIDGNHPLAPYLCLFRDGNRLHLVQFVDTEQKVAWVLSEVPFDKITVDPKIPDSIRALKPADMLVGGE